MLPCYSGDSPCPGDQSIPCHHFDKNIWLLNEDEDILVWKGDLLMLWLILSVWKEFSTMMMDCITILRWTSDIVILWSLHCLPNQWDRSTIPHIGLVQDEVLLSVQIRWYHCPGIGQRSCHHLEKASSSLNDHQRLMLLGQN